MFRGLTIYEIRKIISEQLTFASTGSTGAIQGSLKRLMEKGYIRYEEAVENKVTKKIYYVTEDGKKKFVELIHKPMVNKMTDLELSKLMFMGYVKREDRSNLVDQYIADVRKEYDLLVQVKKVQDEALLDEVQIAEIYQQMAENYGGAAEYMTPEGANDIAFFGKATLDFGVGMLEFIIDWYEKLKIRMEQIYKNESE